MAKEKNAGDPAPDIQVLQAQHDALMEEVAALRAAAENNPVNSASIAPAAPKAPTRPVVEIEGAQYEFKAAEFVVDNRLVKAEEVAADESKLLALFAAAPGIFRKISALLLFVLFALSTAQASTVVINAYEAEVVATAFKNREVFPLQGLVMFYKSSTDALEIQTSGNRSKIWGGDIDSLTISGASTTAAKLAFLRTLMLESTTTNGYRYFIGRENLRFYYTTATSRVEVKYGSDRQALWTGHIDSLKCNGTTATLAYLRLLNRYRAQDCLPSTSVATIAAGAAAGSSPTVSVTGDAFSGSISVTTGTSATTGTLATVTLKITAPTGTRVTLNATGNNSLAHAVRTRATGTTTTLVLTVPTTALSDATAYTWDYTVVPY